MKKPVNILIAAMLIAAAAQSPADDTNQPGDRVWRDRPWEIRYILFLSDDGLLKAGITGARKSNTQHRKPGHELVYLFAEEMFEPTATFKAPGMVFPLTSVLIEFDKTGHAATKSTRLSSYTAKRNMLSDLVLVRTDAPAEKPYRLAQWSQGIPGADQFSPAVCDVDDLSRYDDDWRDYAGTGTFGCREWTAQLYNWERPYIDVTTYAKAGSFIGRFIGWSRFTDPPKPVIGLQGKTWLCLHECPPGETPGIIPNIKAWAAKHNFPMPKRPRKQPEFPNSDFKDDIEE